ncbi:MAG: hypothetical protein AAF368_05635 [Planctomycetota bacterium]
MIEQSTDLPFGGRLLEALNTHGQDAYSSHLSTPDEQRLRNADRDAALELFRGSEFAVMRRLKEESPEDIAAYLSRHSEQVAAGVAQLASVWVCGHPLR